MVDAKRDRSVSGRLEDYCDGAVLGDGLAQMVQRGSATIWRVKYPEVSFGRESLVQVLRIYLHTPGASMLSLLP